MKLALGRLGSAGNRTLIQRAIASLRARGNDAHLWLPGVGTVNGLTTGNYLESTGNSVATVDNPVGLVLDALGTVGVEKLSNIGGPFTNTTGFIAGNSAALSVVSGAMRVQQNGMNYPTAGINFTTVAGSVYKVTFRVVKGTSAQGIAIRAFNLSIGLGGAQLAVSLYKTADGEYTLVFTAVSTTSSIYAIVNTTVLGAYDDIASISVREVTGIHLTQGTTANKPILQKTDSKYSWTFDGSNDSLALGSVPFQMGDDHCVIAGARCIDSGNTNTIFVAENGVYRVAQLRVSGGFLQAVWSDDAPVALNDSTPVINTTIVGSCRQVGSSVSLRKNGTTSDSGTRPSGSTVMTSAKIGVGNTTELFAGTTGPVLAIKGTVTDAELLMYERLIASLTPNGPVF